ncbi:MAG TPA: alcohol dehydrogenase catalytic domain-containing protein [Thermoanaerobaculia bacterium]|nr:alcohol dehydrogenase catalytic domain-containing protein [Thermoanaerobaculia bacterium]
MLALVFEEGRARVRKVRAPALRRGDALVKVSLSGICNTDLELRAGYHGFSGIPGHEFVGVVAGPRRSRLLGRRVVGEINLACRRCAWCRRGLERHCPRRTVLGIRGHPGAHTELLTLPEDNLYIVPAGIPDEEAVFTEPLAAACEILDQVPVTSRTRAAVLGPGKLGTLCAAVLSGAGARVTLVGRRDRAPEGSFDLVVEATGSPAGMPRAIALVRPRGTIVWKSTHHAPARFDAAPVVVNEVTIVGSRCGRFAPALELLRRRRVDVRSLIQEEFPLAQAVRALAAAGRPHARKVLLRPGF